MNKNLKILISAVLAAAFISGCSSRAIPESKRNNTQSSTAGTSAKVSKDTSKLTDGDLMSIANDKDETALTEDRTDIDKDLDSLDNILNQKDTLSDIPKSTDIK